MIEKRQSKLNLLEELLEQREEEIEDLQASLSAKDEECLSIRKQLENNRKKAYELLVDKEKELDRTKKQRRDIESKFSSLRTNVGKINSGDSIGNS